MFKHLKAEFCRFKNCCQKKICQFQHNSKEEGDNGFDKTNDNMETANNVDIEVNINSDSDDSDSEAEDLEKLWQRQQNWNEGGNTDDDYDSYDDTDYELQLKQQQLSLQGLQADFDDTEYMQGLQAHLMTGQKLQPFAGP